MSDSVGRIPVINLNPHQSELYFMRLLLYHRPGALSFEDLRTIDGELQPTFQAACLKMGLLDDDKEIHTVTDHSQLTFRFRTAYKDISYSSLSVLNGFNVNHTCAHSLYPFLATFIVN